MASVFLLSALLSLLNHISYKSALDGIKRFAFGLILITVSAAPFLSALSELGSFKLEILIPDMGETDGADSEIYELAFANGIRDAVAEKFELKASEVRVLVSGFSEKEWRCEKIRIILSGSAAFADYHKIEDYINKKEIGVCEAEIEIG